MILIRMENVPALKRQVGWQSILFFIIQIHDASSLTVLMHAPFPSTIAKLSKQAPLPFAPKTAAHLATSVGPSPSPSPPPDDNHMDLTAMEEAPPADAAAAAPLAAPPAPVSAAPPAAPAAPAVPAPVKEKLSKVSKKPLFIFGRHVDEVKLADTKTGYVARAYKHLGDALK